MDQNVGCDQSPVVSALPATRCCGVPNWASRATVAVEELATRGGVGMVMLNGLESA